MMDIGIASLLVKNPNWEKAQSKHPATICSAKWKFPPKSEDTLHYSRNGDGQAVHVVLTKDSTEEDPVVRITGLSYSGEFDFTCHINDIDPRNASYAEMCALVSWQDKIHPINSFHDIGLVLPTPLGMEIGNVLQRQNFVSRSSSYLASGKFGPSIADQTKELLSLYDQVIQSNHPDDIQAYCAYRRAADDALMELLNLV